MLTEGDRTVHRALTALITGQFRGQPSHEVAPQRPLPRAEPKHVGHMHEAGGTTTDPVGILFGETLHAGDDETAF